MCGLHGIITNKRETNADDFIKSAFVANMLRGVDSSGIASINVTKNTYDYHKLPISGMYFTGDSVAQRIIRSASNENSITMCHVRAATVGNVNVSNAHPFIYEGTGDDDGRIVIGTHNGTLTGWANQKNAKYYNVDSEWAINHIALEGFDAFENIRGAFCFVWWDSDKKDTLNIARNSERPMYVAMLESGGMAYASEAGMLHWLLARHRVKAKGDILELQEDYWYKFNVSDPTEFDKIKLPSTYHVPKTRTYPNNTTSYSTVDRVAAIIAKAKLSLVPKGEVEPVTEEAKRYPPRQASVSPLEYDSAKKLGVLGEEALFTPIAEWADGTEGIAVVMNSELSASVRGCDSPFDSDEEWTCKVIGVQDDGDDMTVILSSPTMKNRKVKDRVH